MPEDVLKLHHLTIAQPGEPLIAALAVAIPGLTKTQARRAVQGGLVKVDGKIAKDATGTLSEHHRVDVDLRHGVDKAFKAAVHGEAYNGDRPLEVLWSDHRLIVVNKSPGILAAPGKADPGGRVERGHVPELLRRVLSKQGRKVGFMGIIHRLDKETSGCLILAFDHEAQRMVSEQFATHAASRTYHAMVENHPRGESGEIRGKQGRGKDGRRVMVNEDEAGVEAVTKWRVLNRYVHGDTVEATLETGRTHQIRVALNSLGCPVWGDRVYRDRRWRVPAVEAPRLMLHAHKLAFDHPDDGRRIEVVSPIPPVFAEFAKALDKPKV